VKRPQGFDRPPAARAPRGAAETSSTAPAAAASAPPEAPADRVVTEPIPVAASAARGAGRGAEAPRAAGRDASSATAVLDGEGAFADQPPSTAAPRDARSARRALAAAARERRRYERQEVRRFTKRSRRRRITWAVVGGAVVALVAVIAVGAYSPLMALREVRIEGAQRIPAAEVQAAFTGVIGTPLPLIESGEVQEALEAFPLIETYATETIPPGTLVVRIVERTPVGVIDTGSGLELVDAAGVVIERPEERPEGQPLIEVDGGVANEGFRAVASVVRSLPAEVRTQLTRATAATADDVRLELAGGATVVWGSAEESAFKAAVLARLMGAAPPDTVSAYDVSSPRSAVTE
jgi:cell division protein FtsQ